MQLTKHLVRTGFSLSLMLAAGQITAASADEQVIIEKTGGPSYSTVISPATTTYTKTTVVQPAPLDTVTTRTVSVAPDAPIVSRSSSSTTISEEQSGLGKPLYGERLRALKEQLDKAESKGWITGTEALSLNNRYNDLVAQEAAVRAHGYLKVDCDAIEKNLTGFNIQLSQDMAGANQDSVE